MIGLNRSAQETVIRWDAPTPTVPVWRCEPQTLRKLKKLGYTPAKIQAPGGFFLWDMRNRTLRRPDSESGTPPRPLVFPTKSPPRHRS